MANSPLFVEHGSSYGFQLYSNGPMPASEYLSISSTSEITKYRVTWNVTDSFISDVYNGSAELWVVTKF